MCWKDLYGLGQPPLGVPANAGQVLRPLCRYAPQGISQESHRLIRRLSLSECWRTSCVRRIATRRCCSPTIAEYIRGWPHLRGTAMCQWRGCVQLANGIIPLPVDGRATSLRFPSFHQHTPRQAQGPEVLQPPPDPSLRAGQCSPTGCPRRPIPRGPCGRTSPDAERSGTTL